MRGFGKTSACQYYSTRGYCAVLKLTSVECPQGCSFFQVKDQNYASSPDITEECRFFQQKGIYTVCCKKGEIISSCAGCPDYEFIDNHDSHLPSIGLLFRSLDPSFDTTKNKYREIDARTEKF